MANTKHNDEKIERQGSLKKEAAQVWICMISCFESRSGKRICMLVCFLVVNWCFIFCVSHCIILERGYSICYSLKSLTVHDVSTDACDALSTLFLSRWWFFPVFSLILVVHNEIQCNNRFLVQNCPELHSASFDLSCLPFCVCLLVSLFGRMTVVFFLFLLFYWLTVEAQARLYPRTYSSPLYLSSQRTGRTFSSRRQQQRRETKNLSIHFSSSFLWSPRRRGSSSRLVSVFSPLRLKKISLSRIFVYLLFSHESDVSVLLSFRLMCLAMNLHEAFQRLTHSGCIQSCSFFTHDCMLIIMTDERVSPESVVIVLQAISLSPFPSLFPVSRSLSQSVLFYQGTH